MFFISLERDENENLISIQKIKINRQPICSWNIIMKAWTHNLIICIPANISTYQFLSLVNVMQLS